jgi:imidazolonepropionase-like amidohydrolase
MPLLCFTFTTLLSAGQADRILLRQVNIVDVNTGKLAIGKDVLIEGKQIKQIASSISATSNQSTIIDAKGKFLIPGLVDFDAMITNREYHKEPGLTLMLAFGVTTVRDRGPVNPLDFGIRLQKEIESGERIGPRIWLISPFIANNGRAEQKVEVATPEQASTAVEAFAKQVDVIRADNSLSPELLKAVVSRANLYNKPVVSRITYPFEDAAAAGLHMIDHASELRRNTSVNRQIFFDFSNRVISGKATREEQYNQVLPELGPTDTAYFLKTINAMKTNHTWLCIGPSSYMPSVIQFELNDTARHVYKSQRQLELMRKTRADYEKITDADRYKNFVDLKEIKWAHDLGLRMVIGSAMGQIHTPGLGMHDSFYWLKQNGFSPIDILRMATINPATFMKKDHMQGGIKENYIADMVLLDANPLEDIENCKQIYAVICNGKLFTRKDLDQLIRQSEMQ